MYICDGRTAKAFFFSENNTYLESTKHLMVAMEARRQPSFQWFFQQWALKICFTNPTPFSHCEL